MDRDPVPCVSPALPKEGTGGDPIGRRCVCPMNNLSWERRLMADPALPPSVAQPASSPS